MGLLHCKHRLVKVKRTIWPYPPGYGTQCAFCKTIFDVGLPKIEAEKEAQKLMHPKRQLKED